MMRWLALAILTGCSQIFGLDVPILGDATFHDGAGDSGGPDSACVNDATDEDLDGIPNGCDACPTIPSTASDTTTTASPTHVIRSRPEAGT